MGIVNIFHECHAGSRVMADKQALESVTIGKERRAAPRRRVGGPVQQTTIIVMQ